MGMKPSWTMLGSALRTQSIFQVNVNPNTPHWKNSVLLCCAKLASVVVILFCRSRLYLEDT